MPKFKKDDMCIIKDNGYLHSMDYKYMGMFCTIEEVGPKELNVASGVVEHVYIVDILKDRHVCESCLMKIGPIDDMKDVERDEELILEE